MAKFVLLFHGEAGSAEAPAPGEVRQIVGEMIDWTASLRTEGRLLGGHKLTQDPGRAMRKRDGKVEVMDGPFAETKELIGGFIMIEAVDYDTAVRISTTCPQLNYGGHIEIRRIDEVHD